MSKVKIISFSKPVDNLTAFFLDNGLASLAASIKADGHAVMIEDYGRLEMVDYFKPDETIHGNIRNINEEFLNLSRKGKNLNSDQIKVIGKSIDELKSFQREKIDELAQQDAEKAYAENLDAVLVKVWNGLGTYYFSKLTQAIRELEKKEKRHIHIFGGGPQVGWFNTHLLQVVPGVDGLIFGEGEESLRMILARIAKNEAIDDVPGLIYWKNNRIVRVPEQWVKRLNEMPLPIYDSEIYPANRRDQKIQFITIDSSRGCPNKCYFCNHHIESGDYWRSKSAELVVEEIKSYVDRYGARYFKYSGSSTPPNLRMDIARGLIEQNIKIRYVSFINTNTVTEKDIALLKESGCFAVFFGIESGSSEILSRSIGTKNSLENIKRAVTLAKEAGIYTVGSLIIPAPHDTNETIRETLDFMLDIGVDAAPVLPPGLTGTETHWSKYSDDFGIEKEEGWIEKMIHWDINLNIPSVFWDRLPYTVNGMKFEEFSKVTNRAANYLLRNGISQASDELALFAKLYSQDTNDFIFDTNIEVRESDTDSLKKKIMGLNERIQCGENDLI